MVRITGGKKPDAIPNPRRVTWVKRESQAIFQPLSSKDIISREQQLSFSHFVITVKWWLQAVPLFIIIIIIIIIIIKLWIYYKL